MLLMDAKAQIDARLTETTGKEYRESIPEYYEALEIASKCIGAQLVLADILNDWEFKDVDTFSTPLVKELLDNVWFENAKTDC